MAKKKHLKKTIYSTIKDLQASCNLLKAYVLHRYFDDSYTSSSGEDIRLVIGRIRQEGEPKGYRYIKGAMVVVKDSEGETEGETQHVEFFDGPTAIRQLRLRKSRLAELARAHADSSDFLEAVAEIVENSLLIDDIESYEQAIEDIESYEQDDYSNPDNNKRYWF